MKSIFTLTILFLNLSVFGQQSEIKDCYEIKYLDFFELEDFENSKWPDSEIKELMTIDFEKTSEDSIIRTNFIIPVIAFQLKEYHPKCNLFIDSNYFNKITKLYFNIRGIDFSKFSNDSISNIIDFIRDDFYSLVGNEKSLSKMIMTIDGGPFYGLPFENDKKLKVIDTLQTEFGVLIIAKDKNKIILSSKNKSGKILWQKYLTKSSNKKLRNLMFIENPLEYNSVATVVNMSSEGKRLTLYLKNDGRFMFYFHSW